MAGDLEGATSRGGGVLLFVLFLVLVPTEQHFVLYSMGMEGGYFESTVLMCGACFEYVRPFHRFSGRLVNNEGVFFVSICVTRIGMFERTVLQSSSSYLFLCFWVSMCVDISTCSA